MTVAPMRTGPYRSGRQKLVLYIVAIVVVGTVLAAIVWAIKGGGTPEPKRTEFHTSKGAPYSAPEVRPVPAVVHLPQPTPPAQGLRQATAKSPSSGPDPVLEAPISIKNQNSGMPTFLKEKAGDHLAGKDEDGADGEDNALTQSLKRSNLGGVSKARVDKNYLYEISAGRHIPCNRTTATNSQLPGFVTCDIPNDIYNDEGSVPLLPKGTHVFGEYKTAVLQGNNRLFVLWREIRTNDRPPIKIPINSPAADQLGRAGMDGVVNNHFWEAFFATAIYTLLEAGPQLATAAIQNGSHSTNEFQFNSLASPTQSLGSRILQDRMNRPPTLESNPGEPLMIFVGSDIDCSPAVQLRLIGAR